MNVERLQIFVGGFSGPSNYVEFSINTNGMGVRFVQSKAGRHYDFDEPTFDHSEVQESTLSTLQV